MSRAAAPEPYLARLQAELAGIKEDLDAILGKSTIEAVNAPPMFVTASEWRWGPSDAAASAARMSLLGKFRSWFDRFMLLFPHPTPDISRNAEQVNEFVKLWLARGVAFDYSIPRTVEEAKQAAAAKFAVLDELLGIASHAGDKTLRVVPDTSALLRNPGVETYGSAVGATSYLVHIVTAVLGELDDLKDRGRTADVREDAEKVVRRLKGLRDRGSLAEGVTVAGNVRLRLEHREIDARSVLSWLDPAVPDDRIVAAALRLQSDNPAGNVVLITRDLNLQNKADAVGLAYAEPPPP